MVKGLYTAYTGMINEQNRLDILSNNLANADTNGYKKEGATNQTFADELAIKIKDTSSYGMPQKLGTMSMGVHIGETYTDYSQGNFRVNKVVREIMSKYIPFTADIRYHLMENPLYRSAFSVYENNIIQIEKKYRNTLKKYKDDGGTLTQDMMDTLHFYQK